MGSSRKPSLKFQRYFVWRLNNVWYTFLLRFVQQSRSWAKMHFVTYTFVHVWCNPSICFGKVIRLNNVWLRLDNVCHTFRTNPMSGSYVWIRFVQQCRETQKGKKITTLATARLLLARLWVIPSPSGPPRGSPLRLVTFEIRFYYVWEHPSTFWY